MTITVQLPDDLFRNTEIHPDPAQEALVALAIQGYREESLSLGQAGRLLGLSRFEFEGVLKARGIHDHAYDVADLQRDIETGDNLRAAGLIPG